MGISGASGLIYGVRLLEMLRDAGIPAHVVVSRGARTAMGYEMDTSIAEIGALAAATHAPGDLAAPIASGSFRTAGMIIVPCSVKTLAEVATGTGDTLVCRAAEVTLKERRRLVMLVRETPLTLTHLRNMATVTENGAIVTVPAPAWYLRPRTLDDIIDQTAGRLLDLFGISIPGLPRWTGDQGRRRHNGQHDP